MAQLSKDTSRPYEMGYKNDIPVKAATTIYQWSAVGDDAAGYARQLVAGDPFRGFAVTKADNGTGAAGDINVNLYQEGYVELAIAALAITDVGKPVYASDGNTFTLTATGNSYVGRVKRWVSTGVGVVEFDAGRGSLGLIAALTDNSTGAVDGIIADVGAAFNQATLNNNFADLAAKINVLSQMLSK